MFKIEKKKIIKYSIKSLIVLFVFSFLIITILNTVYIYKAYKTSKFIETNIYEIQTQLKNKEFDNLLITTANLNSNSKALKKYLNKIIIIDKIPVISSNIKAVNNLSEIAILSSDAIIRVYPIIKENYSVISNLDSLKIISMPKDQKAKIISSIHDIESDFDTINQDINKIVEIINNNKNNKNLIKPIKDIWDKIDSNYSTIENVQKFFPLIEALPDLLGTPKSSKYLLLFQNNTELRPTGGFIGTYGTLSISNGEIGKIFTDNIYNLDRSYKNTLKITPPNPIKTYLGLDNLYLRDSNWNPDYEESAKYMEYIYKGESQNQYPITGVIAITPSVLQDVIGYFGEIKAMGLTFNRDNATDLLNYETKFAYWETRGISESQRKIVIQKLADVLFEKIKSLSVGQIKDLTNVVINNLDKKQILLYFNNKEAQKFATDNNWSGKMINSNNSDYFAVVDANLSSGKSDPYIDKDIDYDLRFVGDDLIATLNLTYTHRYDDYIKNEIYQDDLSYVQQYKSYTRIYVPEGSTLSSLQINDDEPTTDNIDIKNENGKTYFGIYLTVPKNETYTYKFEYKIPKTLVNSFENEYSLIYQKQAGVVYNKININVDLNTPIQSYIASNNSNLSYNYYNKKFNINGMASNDEKINIKFYSNSDIGYLKKIIKKKYLSFQKEAPLGN